jgi:hypothetical protein
MISSLPILIPRQHQHPITVSFFPLKSTTTAYTMATNKKKGSKRTKEVKTGAAETTQYSAASFTPPSLGALSKGQFNLLLLLSIGISRLQPWRAATLAPTKDDGEEINSTCAEYLGEACRDTFVQSLIHLKLASGIHCVLLVVAVMFQVWHYESILQQFNSLLLLSPIATTMVVLASSQTYVVSGGKIWSQLLMCMVLVAVALPSGRTELPFLAGRTHPMPLMTLQGVWLLSLAALAMTQVWHLLWPEVEGTLAAEHVIYGMGVPTEATQVVMRFLAVDFTTAFGIYLFVYYHLPEGLQRVSMRAQNLAVSWNIGLSITHLFFRHS